MKHLSIVIIMLLISTYSVFGQRESMNGLTLPLDDTIKVMLVFAEMDHTPCGNSNSPSSLWPVGSVPSDADDYFYANSNVAGYPSGYITKYMHEASFGQYNVLGDYYKNVVTVPCNAVNGWGTNYIIDSLDKAYNNGNLILE